MRPFKHTYKTYYTYMRFIVFIRILVQTSHRHVSNISTILTGVTSSGAIKNVLLWVEKRI